MSAAWRVGDVVVVHPECSTTNLGEGSIIDIKTMSGNEFPVAALVRFEHGAAAGYWYSVGNLQKLGDIRSNVAAFPPEPEMVGPVVGPVVEPKVELPEETYVAPEPKVACESPSDVLRKLAATLDAPDDVQIFDDDDEFILDY